MPGRLNRQLGKRFGDDQYAMEECIVEVAACMLCARLGIQGEPHPDPGQFNSCLSDEADGLPLLLGEGLAGGTRLLSGFPDQIEGGIADRGQRLGR